MNTIFIIILIIVIIAIFLYNKYEFFNKIDLDLDLDINNKNSFYYRHPNIYFTKQFTDNLFVPPKPQISTLQSIDINSYVDSNIVSNKIICANITNQGKCWDNNNCEWVEKVGEKSFCKIAPKMLL